jgi:hypothetical protein
LCSPTYRCYRIRTSCHYSSEARPTRFLGKEFFAKCRDQLGRKRPRQGRMDWPETEHWADDKGFSGGVWSKTDTKKVWEPGTPGGAATSTILPASITTVIWNWIRFEDAMTNSDWIIPEKWPVRLALIHSWEEYCGHWQRACRTVILYFQPVKSAGGSGIILRSTKTTVNQTLDLARWTPTVYPLAPVALLSAMSHFGTNLSLAQVQ